MENVEKIAVISTDQAAALPLLTLAIADDVQGVGILQIVRDCQFFELVGIAGARFAYAVQGVGSELWIQAAGGAGGMDLTAFGLAAVETQAAGVFRSVGFQTRRRGLVKKAIKAGYKVDGYIMRKTI